MNIDLKEIQALTEKIEYQKQKLRELREQRSRINFGGHQEHCSISVGGVKFDCTTLGRETGWAARIKPGYDMMILAAQKLLNAAIDDQQILIKSTELKLKKLLYDFSN